MKIAINIAKIRCVDFVKIKHILKLADQNTLVVFDIDDVLISPINNHDFWRPNHQQWLQKIKRQLSNPSNTLLDSVSISSTEYCLTDPEIINIFMQLKNDNILTIALTAMGSGTFGTIDSLEDLRIQKLKAMGIDFTTLNTIDEQIPTNELKDLCNIHKSFNIMFTAGSPMLKNGIMFTAGIDKGTALEYILRKKNYHPKTIIFIDDHLCNIESLEKVCRKLQINFYGCHYIAAALTPTAVLTNINCTKSTTKKYLLKHLKIS